MLQITALLDTPSRLPTGRLNIGDTVAVYKSNKIIPQIAENRTMSNTFKLPMICPCCGEALIRKTTNGGTSQLYCENPSCSAKLVQKFVHFCEKTRMNIEGLSETTLKKFVSHGWIKNFGDLYDLEQHREAIINTDGFGVKSYHCLQTVFFEADPANVTGLHREAIEGLIEAELLDTFEDCTVGGCPAAKGIWKDRAYLCWTLAPEFSFVIEYSPESVSEADIFRMAESVVLPEPVPET